MTKGHALRRSARLMTIICTGAAALTFVLGAAAAARAQEKPIPAFAADVRGGLSRFKADVAVAASAAVTVPNLPTRGLGIIGGAHWYVLHMRAMTIGIGGEVLATHASRTLPPPSEGAPNGPTVRTHFSAFSPQLSFNFGKRDGWSYISGGLGRATFFVDTAEHPLTQGHTKSLNYGGGARWFTKKHVAVSVDLRFYALSPQPQSDTSPGFPRTRNMVFSVGVGFRL